MSKYKVIETQFKDLSLVIDALREIFHAGPQVGHMISGVDGVELSQHRTNDLTLYDYHGMARPERATLVIRRHLVNQWSSGASNDIGFAWDAESQTYRMIVSEYDLGSPGSKRLVSEIKKQYAANAVIRQARARGYIIRQEAGADGTVTITLKKP